MRNNRNSNFGYSSLENRQLMAADVGFELSNFDLFQDKVDALIANLDTNSGFEFDIDIDKNVDLSFDTSVEIDPNFTLGTFTPVSANNFGFGTGSNLTFASDFQSISGEGFSGFGSVSAVGEFASVSLDVSHFGSGISIFGSATAASGSGGSSVSVSSSSFSHSFASIDNAFASCSF